MVIVLAPPVILRLMTFRTAAVTCAGSRCPSFFDKCWSSMAVTALVQNFGTLLVRHEDAALQREAAGQLTVIGRNFGDQSGR